MAVLSACAGYFVAGAVEACDVEYVIQPDDTLTRIAETAYGTKNFQLIFSRNPNLRLSAVDLPIGEAIIIPCIEGDALFTPDAEALIARMNVEAPEPAEETQPQVNAVANAQSDESAAPAVETVASDDDAPQPASPSPAPTPTASGSALKVLTANGLAPYADEALRNGGMVTDLVRIVAGKSPEVPDISIIAINDRAQHLDALLVNGSFDIGYPWLKPSCDQLGILEAVAPTEAWMCRNFTFSEPYYEFVNGFFVMKGAFSRTRADFADFAESRICRPSGESVSDLIAVGISDGEATKVRPDTMADCMTLLTSGQVDAVSGDVFEAEEAARTLGVYDKITELPDLSLLATVHVIAPNNKPNAVAALGRMDEELIGLKLSGEWFRIVTRHLAQN